MVVVLEVFVMEVVGIAVRCDRRLLADDDPLEPGMAVRRRQPGMKQLEQCVDRMRGHDPVDEHAGEIEQMLDRVHRDARPGARVDVVVMQLVHRAIERRPMNQPVHDVEMELAEQRDQQHEQHEPHRVGMPIEVRDDAVGEGPEGHRLVGGPDRDAAGEGPDQIVGQLAAEEERLVDAVEPLAVELEGRSLRFSGIERQVEQASRRGPHALAVVRVHTIARQHHRIRTGSVRHPDQRARVARVGRLNQHHDQRR